MSIVKIQGNASGTGTLTIAAPNTNSDRTLTLPDASGTVQVSGNPISGTTGTFSGAVQASGVATNLYPLVSGTAQASTSGTSIDFTGIPSWVKRITVIFNGVSTNGTSHLLIQVGSGSITTTGYLSYFGYINTTTNIGTSTSTSGFGMWHGGVIDTHYQHAVITPVSGNTWLCTHSGGFIAGTTHMVTGGGNVTLSGALDRVRITTVNGTDTFDAGTINILYE